MLSTIKRLIIQCVYEVTLLTRSIEKKLFLRRVSLWLNVFGGTEETQTSNRHTTLLKAKREKQQGRDKQRKKAVDAAVPRLNKPHLVPLAVSWHLSG